jgi:hypothetical protein
MIKIYIDGEKEHTELVNNSLILIAEKISKKCQLFRLLAELNTYANIKVVLSNDVMQK